MYDIQLILNIDGIVLAMIDFVLNVWETKSRTGMVCLNQWSPVYVLG